MVLGIAGEIVMSAAMNADQCHSVGIEFLQIFRMYDRYQLVLSENYLGSASSITVGGRALFWLGGRLS